MIFLFDFFIFIIIHHSSTYLPSNNINAITNQKKQNREVEFKFSIYTAAFKMTFLFEVKFE